MHCKLAVCDDPAADRQYIQSLAGRWAARRGHTVHVEAFPSAEALLFQWEERKDYDILLLESGGGLVRLPLYQIRWAEVSGNYVTVHAAVAVTARMTLGDLEKRLDERFYRIGRSAIVNLTEIRRVTKTELRLADGAVLSTSGS